jgi:pimeloyl-ACP methyl ester carboxylesterase
MDRRDEVIGAALYVEYPPPAVPYELPRDPSTARRERTTRWVGFGFATLLVTLVAYFGYVGYEGSRQLTDPPSRTDDCRTPADLGWAYQAINYDPAGDATTVSPDAPVDCSAARAKAGDAVTSPGGVRLAGWYVPAGNGDPAAPTIVLAHGWGSSKSDMLDRAALLHDRYDLVLFDFRNHGQSDLAPTTQGVREATDLRAILDWLVTASGEERIGVLGVSMGGASALAEGVRDERVDAFAIESTHATIGDAAEARIARAGYPLALPGSWAVLLGTLLRTGQDISSVDPLAIIDDLDGRPVLLVAGGRDDSMGADDPQRLEAAAREAGTPVELHVCAAAGHAEAPDVCPQDYAAWVVGFFDRAFTPPG